MYLSADTYQGRPKPKTLYRIELFKGIYYVLCCQQRVITLFSSEMISNDADRGGLIFRDEKPFGELTSYFT